MIGIGSPDYKGVNVEGLTAQLLQMCAKVLAAEAPGPVPLGNSITSIAALGREFREREVACVAYLAAQVAELTDGRRTVRSVPVQLLQDAPGGINNLFVVVCDADTPQGQVTNPVDGMTPYVIGVADAFTGLRLTFKPASS